MSQEKKLLGNLPDFSLLILCGGKAKRLSRRNKPLLPVRVNGHNKPMIDHIIDACEGVSFFLTDGDGEDATERAARFSCSISPTDENSNAGEPYWDITDAIVVGRICYTINDGEGNLGEHRCAEGEVFTVSNDAGVPMSAVDLDAMLTPFVEDAIEYAVPNMERTTPWEQLRDRFEDGIERLEKVAIERSSERD